MSFIKNPFRKTAPAKSQQKIINPAAGKKHPQVNAQGVNADKDKSSLPNNYLDPKSVF